jgi:hypothetical protein
MKLQEKDKLLRGILSAPNALDAKLNLLHTSYQRTVPQSSTSQRNRQTLQANSPVLYNSSKIYFLEGSGIRKKRNDEIQMFQNPFAIGTDQVTVQEKMETITQ